MGMIDFYKFNSQLDDLKGLYDDLRVPPPPPYEFQDYMKLVSSKPESLNCGDGRFSQWQPRPLNDDEMTTTARPDYEDMLSQPPHKMNVNLDASVQPIGDLKTAGLTTWSKSLGEPLDDDGFKKYTGIRW